MKKSCLFLVFIFTMLLCYSCRTNETINNDRTTSVVESDNSSVEKIEYNIPDSFTQAFDNIIFNTDVIVNPKVKEEGLYYTTATFQAIDYQKAYEILYKEKDNVLEDKFEGNEGSGIFYQNDNYESLSLAPDGLFYLTADASNYMRSFSVDDDDYNADKFSTKQEFEFADKETALKEIKEIMKEVGLNIEGTYNCYSLDYQTLEKEEYSMGIDGKEDTSAYKDEWTNDDNGYFFIAHQNLQNCLVQYPILNVFEKLSEQNASIKILYTKKGLQFVTIENIFEFNISDKYLQLQPFEDVIKQLVEKYKMLLTNTNYIVTKAELYMRPIKISDDEFEVIPTWQFIILEESSGNESEMYINAITGEEIYGQ